MIALLRQDPLAFFLAFLLLAFSLALHEAAHAYAAWRFGDPTAKRLGRLTLNPLRHLDPLGTVLLLLVGFGWAKPVPVNPAFLRPYRLGLFAVSVAGIVANLLLAVLFALSVRLLWQISPLEVLLAFRGEGVSPVGVLALSAFFASSINLVLAVFNLLPIPPLDGSKILQSLLPLAWQPFLWGLERYAWVSFLLILTVLQPPIQAVLRAVRGAFFGLFL